MVKLTTEQVKIFADLARIELTDKELERFSGEMGNILDYIEKLNEVDVSDIDFASHIEDFKGSRLRKDQPGEPLSIEQIFLNAKSRRRGDSFITSKII